LIPKLTNLTVFFFSVQIDGFRKRLKDIIDEQLKSVPKEIRKELRSEVDEANVVIENLREERTKGSEVAEIMAQMRKGARQDIRDLERLEELKNFKVRLG